MNPDSSPSGLAAADSAQVRPSEFNPATESAASRPAAQPASSSSSPSPTTTTTAAAAGAVNTRNGKRVLPGVHANGENEGDASGGGPSVPTPQAAARPGALGGVSASASSTSSPHVRRVSSFNNLSNKLHTEQERRWRVLRT